MSDPVRPAKVSVSFNLFGKGSGRPHKIGPDRALPAEYQATVDDPALPFLVLLDVVVEEGRPAIDAIALRRRDGGPPISARAVRDIPIRRLLSASLASAELRIEEPTPGRFRLSPLSDDEVAEADRTASRIATTRRRRTNPTTDVDRAMHLYEEALDQPAWKRKPTIYVADQMHVSRATAARLLRRGREGN